MKTRPLIVTAAIVGLLVLAGSSFAQGSARLAKPIYIQATAMGTSTQLGRITSVNINIYEFSTADDQKALLEAFTAKGNEGLVNALEKMSSKGRAMITGTLGFDVTYIRAFKQPDGSTKIRMVTNRPIRFGELWSDSRSLDYNLAGLELIVTKDKKGKLKAEGTAAPACKFKMDKNNQIELELLQNAWKLTNVDIKNFVPKS